MKLKRRCDAWGCNKEILVPEGAANLKVYCVKHRYIKLG